MSGGFFVSLGFEIAKRLREERATTLTPIIFISARGQTKDKVRAFKLGADEKAMLLFLVRDHLKLSLLSQRRDIDDQSTVDAAVRVVRNGLLDRHVPTIRALYKAQRDAMLAASGSTKGLDFSFR
mgnify:CR=1 FL=1